MAKVIAKSPNWIKNSNISDIYSVSGCISETFTDYIHHWKHNGYYFFDSPQIITQLAKKESISLDKTSFFFYESYNREYNSVTKKWNDYHPDKSFPTNIKEPDNKNLQGYDVICFSQGNSPECSPLSCNNLAEHISVNEHCLLPSLENAIKLIESGAFENSEPSPYRIFAVYNFTQQPN